MSEGVLARCRAGEISPQIALSQMILGGSLPGPDALARVAEGEPAGSPVAQVIDLIRERPEQIAALRRVVASGIEPAGEDQLAATAALFDRLATEAPEAAVAFYSLGDPALLDEATAELVALIRNWAPVANRDVLDLGCGIGRVAIALAGEARSVLALDVSAGMVAETRRRGAHCGNLRVEQGTGRDLAGVESTSIDVMIAADSLPFVVSAGLIEVHLAEAARVLRPGGALLVLNWSYRGDLAADIAEARRLAPVHGLAVERAGETPFRIWDGSAFKLVRTT